MPRVSYLMTEPGTPDLCHLAAALAATAKQLRKEAAQLEADSDEMYRVMELAKEREGK